jgi:hypothetical protein
MVKVTKAETVIKVLHKNLKHAPKLLLNGDTLKQLLVRSRYLRHKSSSKWTENQTQRAKILSLKNTSI